MGMRTITAALALAGVAALAAVRPIAAERKWIYLGEANVDRAQDHDVISVPEGVGRLHLLQIRVERAPVQFDHVLVHYGDGSAVPIRVRTMIPAAGETRAIHLPGEMRWVRSVEFYYERASAERAKPKVQLFGAR